MAQFIKGHILKAMKFEHNFEGMKGELEMRKGSGKKCRSLFYVGRL